VDGLSRHDILSRRQPVRLLALIATLRHPSSSHLTQAHLAYLLMEASLSTLLIVRGDANSETPPYFAYGAPSPLLKRHFWTSLLGLT